MLFVNKFSADEYYRIALGSNRKLLIFNDNSSNLLAFSIDGTSLNGIIYPNEGIEFNDIDFNEIYIKSYVAGASCGYRVFAWGKSTAEELYNLICKQGTTL